MPLTKIRISQFPRISLDKYTTLVMVSGSYNQLGKDEIKKIKKWVEKGNTLITIARGSSWAINNELISENLVESKEDSTHSRKNYVDASGFIGRERIGGVILKADIDLTHPIAFGYNDNSIPVYKNNNVFINKTKEFFSLPNLKIKQKSVSFPENIEFNNWLMRNVVKHKVKGYSIVLISLKQNGKPPGDATSDQMRKIAAFSE